MQKLRGLQVYSYEERTVDDHWWFSPPDRPAAAVVEIPLNRIKVATRLRSTDFSKVTDIAESVVGVGLLHPISVSQAW